MANNPPIQMATIQMEELVAIRQSAGLTSNLETTLATGLTETIGDTVIQTITAAAEVKIAEVTTEAKKHLPLAVHICCAAVCCSLFGVVVIAAHITAFVGLAHTQHVDLDPLCPAHYWDGQIALLFVRLLAFLLLGVTLCTVGCSKGICCTTALIACTLATVLSFTIADTVVTAQAWSALNCSVAVRAGRDTDPLLMASGSLFVMIDWLMLLCACSAACRACRGSVGVVNEE
jgi:hypothetical protein